MLIGALHREVQSSCAASGNSMASHRVISEILLHTFGTFVQMLSTLTIRYDCCVLPTRHKIHNLFIP